MNGRELFTELDEIHYRYKWLESLISLLQMMAAEMMEVAGVPRDSLSDALYEIELGMHDNNSRLEELFPKKGGAS